MINFKNGQPSADLLPTQLFSEAAKKALSAPHAAVDMLQYGHELGHPEFLRNLAIFLTRAYHSPVYSQHLCATAGASLSLQHILSILTRPETHTRHVYLQDPTYFLVFDIFLDVGYTRDQWVGIPEEGDSGMRLDVLEDHLIKHDQPNDSTFFCSVLYCVPTHANPTGSILSAEKRQRLVELGKKYNMLIICDDVYDILTFEGDIPKRLVAYDLESQGKSVVISNGSFSKLLAPGARVGWIEANERLIQRVGACGSFISGGSPSYLSSQLINQMLKDNVLVQHVEFLKKTHSDRLYRGLWAPIQEHLVPLGCSSEIRPKGGYFVWLRLPIKGSELMEIAQEHNIDVGVGLGTLFSVSNPDDYCVRLSFAHYDTETLKIGVTRLRQALLIGIST